MLPNFARRAASALPLLGLAALTVGSKAQTSTYSFLFPAPAPVGAPFPFSGTTHPASYAPTFTRPNNASTPAPVRLTQSSGVNAFFDLRTFTVPTTATYDIVSNCGTPSLAATWNNFTLLYGSDITSGSAYTNFLINSLTGCLYANDTLAGTTASSTQSGFTTTLNAGQTYTLVTTSNNNAVGGAFYNTVSSKPTLAPSILNVNGTIGPTSAGPSYISAAGNGNLVPTQLNTNPAYYSKQDFTVKNTGNYSILSTCTISPNWVTNVALYVEDPAVPNVSGFDPANALKNVLLANAASDNTHAGFTATLTAGKVYTLVTSGVGGTYGNFGFFSNGVGYFTNTITPVSGGNLDSWSDDTTYGSEFLSPDGNLAAANHQSWYYDYGTNMNPRILPYAVHTWTATTTGTVTFSETPTPSDWGSFMYIYEGGPGTTPFDPAYDYAAATTGDPTLGNNALNNIVASVGSVAIGNGGGTASASYDVVKGNVYQIVVSGLGLQNFGTFNGSIDTSGTGYIGTTAGSPTYNRPGGQGAGKADGTTLPCVASPTATATPYSVHTFHPYVAGTNTFTVKSSSPSVKLWAALYAAPFDPNKPATASAFTNRTPDASSLWALANTGTTGQVTFSPYIYTGIDYVLVISGDTNTTAGAFTVTSSGPDFVPPVLTYSGSNSYGPGNYVTKILPNGTLPPTALDLRYSTNGELYYEADNFTVTTEGDYDIESNCTLANGAANTTWDNFVTLYHDSVNVNNASSFDPNNPLNNAVIASEGATSSGVSINPIHLKPGVYTLVTSESNSLLTYPNTDGYTATVSQITTPPIAVVSYTGSLQAIATAPGAGLITKLPTIPTAVAGVPPTKPTALSTSTTAVNVPYTAIPFTIASPGVYSIRVTSAAPQSLWTNEFLVYSGTFDNANALTGIQFGAVSTVNGTGTFKGLADNSTDFFISQVNGVTLAAGSYTLVVTGSSNAFFGPFTAEVDSGYLTYPPVLPDNNTTGVSATITVPDTFNLGSLNSVTITGFSHPRVGDLLATLTHNGTTIELLDRVNHLTTGSNDNGAFSIFKGGDYTFAGTGADLGVAAGGLTGSIVDPTLTYAQYLNGSAGQSSNLTGDFTAFNGASVSGPWVLKVTDNKSSGSFTGLTAGYTGFKFNVTPVTATVSGTLTFEGRITTAPAQTVTFLFKPASGASFTQTALVGSDGNYTLTGIPLGTYTLHIKSPINLAVNLPITLTPANLTGANATLPAADANGDNVVDTSDFNILAGAFGAAYNPNLPNSTTGYDPTADFNGDGTIDTSDFNLLVGEFGVAGDPVL